MLVAAVIVAFGISVPATASADTIAVNTPNDDRDAVPDADCSLREAIETANADADFGGCAQTGSSSGPDTITVPAGTYTLTGAAEEDLNVSGDLDVDQAGAADEGGDLTLQGAGDGSNPLADTIIDANTLDRAIDVQSGGGDAVDFAPEDLRIRNGNATDGDGMTATDEDDGGGVRMRDPAGSLTVRRSTIENSDAVRWGGAVSWDNASSGGGAPLEIIDSELTGNTAASGGAVWTRNGGFSAAGESPVAIGGATRILRSTFTQNTASHRGGAIYLKGPADVPPAPSGLSLLNSTIHDNDAGADIATTGGGGAIAMGAGESRLYMHFSTLTENSSADAGTAGGIQADSTAASQRVYLHASILANNTAIGSATDVNCLRSGGAFAPITTNYNVESANTCGLTEPMSGTDNFNESATLLDALAANGGETQTREPVAGSPVLDLVPSADCIDFDKPTTVPVTEDQRGLPRPSPTGGQCDAGSVEAQPSSGGGGTPSTPPTAVTPLAPTTTPADPFDLKAAIKRCKKKHPKGSDGRKNCIKKAKKRDRNA